MNNEERRMKGKSEKSLKEVNGREVGDTVS